MSHIRNIKIPQFCFVILILLILSEVTVAAETSITFSTWYGQDNIEQLIDEYEARNPDVGVGLVETGAGDYYDKIATAMIGGVSPDLVMGEAFKLKMWMMSGLVDDLTPYIERSKHLRQETFFPPAINELSYAGVLFALPLEHNIEVLHYNKDLFDNFAVEYPDKFVERDEWTKDTFLQVARKLTVDIDGDGHPDQFGFNFDPMYWLGTIVRSAGAAYWDWGFTKTRLDEPAATDAIQWMADLRNRWKIWGTGWFTDAYAQGNTGMTFGGDWILGGYRATRNFETGMAPHFIWSRQFPDRRFINILSSGVAMSTQSKHKEEAWTFLEYLMSTEAQMLLARLSGWVPGNVRAARSTAFINRDTGENFMPYLYTVEHYATPTTEKMGPDVHSLLQPALAEAFDGDTSAQEAIQSVAPAMNALVNEWRQQLGKQ